jgi:hypothetical protein
VIAHLTSAFTEELNEIGQIVAGASLCWFLDFDACGLRWWRWRLTERRDNRVDPTLAIVGRHWDV